MKITDIPPIALHEYTADNAMRLLYSPKHSNPLVCLQLYIRSGSVNESDGQRGYAHFLEHLVFKSTIKYPANSISLLASDTGAVLNAYTDFDATCYYLTLPSENLETGMDILAEMAINTNFSAEDIAVEKSIILEEIHQYEAEPEMSFIEYVQKHYFGQNPLKHPVLGDPASIRSASYKSLRQFYEEHYTPDNAFLVVTGDFDASQLISLSNIYFGHWKQSTCRKGVIASSHIDTFRILHRNKKGRDLLALAIPELNESHPDSEALHIAIRHLAIGKSSLLHKRLVEQERLCSSVKVSSLSGLLPGASIILFAPTRQEYSIRIASHFFAAWQEILKNGVAEEELELVKKDIIHSWLYSFDGVENMANLIAAEEFNGNLSRIRNFGAYIESITNSDLIRAVRKHWSLKYLALFLQTKKNETSELEKLVHHLNPVHFAETSTVATPYADITHIPEPAAVQRIVSSPAYHIFNLDNGLKVVYNYQPDSDICGFALSSPLSQLCESAPGLNYFATALMLYGTQFRDHDQILRFSREHGFNIRVLHHLDSTIFRGRCHKADLVHVMNLLSEILSSPAFDKHYLRMLKNAASDNLRRERDYPVSVAYKAWFTQVFGRQNNLFSATGKLADIAAISIEDCEAWHNTWSLGEDFALCIVGSLDPSEVEEIASIQFSVKRNNARIADPVLRFSQTEPRVKRSYKKLDQAIIHVGGLACPASERLENSAFHVLAHVLGGDLSSRLFCILREEMGYAYQTGFDFSSIKDLGFWYAYAFCDSKEHLCCLEALQDILNDVMVAGITQKELDSAKNYLVALARMDNESVSYKATGIANLISLGYDLDYYLNREARIRSTNLETIRLLAANYLNPSNRHVNVLV